MRWRGLLEAGHDLELKVDRIGPCDPTMSGGVWAAKHWLRNKTPGVIAYNDLIAIGFIRMVLKAGCRVPEDVQVVGFDNILDAALLEPRLTPIASPVVSLGSAAVKLLLRTTRRQASDPVELALVPARLIIRDTTVRGVSGPDIPAPGGRGRHRLQMGERARGSHSSFEEGWSEKQRESLSHCGVGEYGVT